MASFRDLTEISRQAIQSQAAGQQARARDTENRLQQLALQQEPARLQRQARKEELNIANIETERAAFAQGVRDQVIPGLIRQMKADPANARRIYDNAQAMIGKKQAQLGYTPEEIAQGTLTFEDVGGVQGLESMYFDMQETGPQSAAGKLIADRQALAQKHGEDSPQVKAIDKIIAKQGKTKEGVTVNVSNQPLTKSTTNQVQKDVIGEEALLADLSTVKPGGENYFDPDRLTIAGRGVTKLAEWMDEVGISTEEQKKRLTQWTKFSNAVSQVFNQYRKEITGAAASVQELEQLKQSLINKDQGPTQFRAAYDQFVKKLERGISAKQKLLTEGIDLSTDEGAAKLDKEIKNQASLAQENVVFSNDVYGDVTEADIQFTMQENGLTREEVMERLNAP